MYMFYLLYTNAHSLVFGYLQFMCVFLAECIE